MGQAWIDGRSVALEAAVAEAARLLAASRLPVIAGLGTDIAGARAAVSLAARLGGAVDHMHSELLLRDLDVLREAGVMLTTPTEARVRADTLLLVGPGLSAAWPGIVPRLLVPPPADGAPRRVVWLCPGPEARTLLREGFLVYGRGTAALPALLALLRARCAGRPVATAPKALDRVVAVLRQAKFGVAAWAPASLDALAGEMLHGLVADLNGATRFSALPLAPPDNAAGVLQACGWMTGFPMRTGFGRGAPEHDPWRFDAVRLVESGEADCALWISAYGAKAPPWSRALPTIVLAGTAARLRTPPRIRIAVGAPGVDHDTVDHCAETGTLAARRAAQPGAVPTAAAALARIAAALPGAPPC